MASVGPLERPEWGEWLLDVAGGRVVRPGQALDPYGSSWRVLSTQARRWLPEIQAGRPISDKERRQDQATSDLRSAGLVAEHDYALTPLGEATLQRWQPLPDTWAYELPLAVALLQEALTLKVEHYRRMVAFWWDVRRVYGADDALLGDREAVLLLTYLNRTVDGFNPWAALRDGDCPLPLPVPWDELREAVPQPTKETTAALKNLQGKLDPSRRLAGRVVFCRAMSLLILRHDSPAAITAELPHIKLPRRAER